MSGVSRRNVLKGAAVTGVATAVPLGAAALGERRLVVYDSRLPASLAFARTVHVEIAKPDDLRAGLGQPRPHDTFVALDDAAGVGGIHSTAPSWPPSLVA